MSWNNWNYKTAVALLSGLLILLSGNGTALGQGGTGREAPKTRPPSKPMPAAKKRAEKEGLEITTSSGLKYVDLIKGHGPSPTAGQTVYCHWVISVQNGDPIESSRTYGRPPAKTVIGGGILIPGLEEGIMSMRPGGKRRFVIPPELGYGAESTPNIPANSTLVIEVELFRVK